MIQLKKYLLGFISFSLLGFFLFGLCWFWGGFFVCLEFLGVCWLAYFFAFCWGLFWGGWVFVFFSLLILGLFCCCCFEFIPWLILWGRSFASVCVENRFNFSCSKSRVAWEVSKTGGLPLTLLIFGETCWDSKWLEFLALSVKGGICT